MRAGSAPEQQLLCLARRAGASQGRGTLQAESTEGPVLPSPDTGELRGAHGSPRDQC